MNLIIFGMQGSGKGTQSKLLVERFSFLHIAPGDVFRQEILSKTPLGITLETYVSKGLLVPDDITLSVIKEYIIRSFATGCILDGFPRNQVQLEGLETLFAEVGTQSDHAIYIAISREEALHRLLGRRICSHCGSIYNINTVHSNNQGIPSECLPNLQIREDENKEAIEKRLAIYEEKTFPLLDFYRSQEKLISVDGMQSISDIHSEIVKKLHL